MQSFKIDDRELRQFSKTTKSLPSYFKRITAEYLNTSAFEHRALSMKNLENNLTIRNKGFLNKMLRVEKTKPVDINSQISISGSLETKDFSGWKEQEFGSKPSRKRTITPAARNRNNRNVVPKKNRMLKANKISKPAQFSGRDSKSRFQFMMRTLGSRGGGNFYLDEGIKTKGGRLTSGLWNLSKFKKSTSKRGTVYGKITLLQKKDNNQTVKKVKWSSEEWDKIRKKAQEKSDALLKAYLERNLNK